jgi:hypothetical protein
MDVRVPLDTVTLLVLACIGAVLIALLVVRTLAGRTL